jgi:single-strand DNA-binding protein
MSLNKVILHGRLGRDPELKHTATGTAVCEFSIATTNFSGKGKEATTEWHNIKVWAKQAENCAKFLTKGQEVLIEGSLRTSSWDDKNGGGKRYKTEIVASNVQFLGKGSGKSTSDDKEVAPSDFSASEGNDATELPF